MTSTKLVLLAAYTEASEAEIVKSKLESEGIRAFVADNNVVSINGFYSNALGGVKVKVLEPDLQRAKEIIETPVDLGPEFEDDRPPQCPRCQSENVIYKRLSGPLFLIFMFSALPLPMIKRRWKCQACKYSWKAKIDSASL